MRCSPLPRLVPAVLTVLALGCQPADDPALGIGTAEDRGDAASNPVGAPRESLPDSLEGLLARLDSTARRWQDDPRVVEIVLELTEDRWTGASVTYLAPDADRFLALRIDAEGTTQERPTFEGFDLQPVPGDALAEVPAPDALLGPAELLAAAQTVLDDCGVGPPERLFYATGAPAAWDGSRWTEEPAWTAAIAGERAAVVDPTTGEPIADPCIPAEEVASGDRRPLTAGSAAVVKPVRRGGGGDALADRRVS